MDKVKVMVDGRIEELDKTIYEYVQKSMEAESQIRSLMCSGMVVEEKLKGMDRIRMAIDEYDDSSWEICITELTDEIRKDLDEIDQHVSPSIDGN